MLHFYGVEAPATGAVAACGYKRRTPRTRKTTRAERVCEHCAWNARCECGDLVGFDRAYAGYALCIDCARSKPAVKITMHGDEATGIVGATVREGDEPVERVVGRVLTETPVLDPAPRDGRDVNGRFWDRKRAFTVDAEHRELHPVFDYWLAPHAGEAIPGEASGQSSVEGHMRGRTKTAGTTPQRPFDRGARDAGRRDFESPVEGRAYSDAELSSSARASRQSVR